MAAVVNAMVVNAMVVNSFEYNAGALYAIVPALAQPAESDWKLVYEDPQSLVFLRDPAPGIPVLDRSRIVLPRHIDEPGTRAEGG